MYFFKIFIEKCYLLNKIKKIQSIKKITNAFALKKLLFLIFINYVKKYK